MTHRQKHSSFAHKI